MDALINSFTKLHKFSCRQGEFEAVEGNEPICRFVVVVRVRGGGVHGMEGSAAEGAAI
jgi:hypothetical protein